MGGLGAPIPNRFTHHALRNFPGGALIDAQRCEYLRTEKALRDRLVRTDPGAV